LSAISFLLEVAGNTNAHVLKIDRACFYCLLGLEIIGCSNKSLWIRLSLHMLTRFYSTHRPILMLWFHLKSVFRLTFRYYL